MIPNLTIDNSCSAQLHLQCQIFDGIINEFVELDKDGNLRAIYDKEVNVLNEIQVELRYQTLKPELSMVEFLQDINYMFTSWLLNIEYIFPLVFSVYGRQFFKLNYTHLQRCIQEMNDHQVVEAITNQTVRTNHEILILNLTKLQIRILNEYNILNVVKEIDHSNYRYKVCLNNKGKTSNQTMGVKNFPYSLALIDAAIQIHTDSNTSQ